MGVHDADRYGDVKDALGIPDDEPVFILRAQDVLSVPAIARYEVLARQVEQNPPSPEWMDHLGAIQFEFEKWQKANTDKVKVPD